MLVPTLEVYPKGVMMIYAVRMACWVQSSTARVTVLTIIIIPDIIWAMYVCICNRLGESVVRSLAEQGMSFEEIQAVTGCSNTCGSCRCFAEELVLSVQLRSHATAPLRVLSGAA